MEVRPSRIQIDRGSATGGETASCATVLRALNMRAAADLAMTNNINIRTSVLQAGSRPHARESTARTGGAGIVASDGTLGGAGGKAGGVNPIPSQPGLGGGGNSDGENVYEHDGRDGEAANRTARPPP